MTAMFFLSFSVLAALLFMCLLMLLFLLRLTLMMCLLLAIINTIINICGLCLFEPRRHDIFFGHFLLFLPLLAFLLLLLLLRSLLLLMLILRFNDVVIDDVDVIVDDAIAPDSHHSISSPHR